MLVQEELQKKISDFLAVLEFSVENRGLIGLLDQNLIAQSFLANLLNIVYGYDLVNLDTGNRQSPAIDLGDFYRRISFQVTSTRKTIKIRETIETFIRKERYKEFSQIKFFIIGKKQGRYPKNLQRSDLFEFDPCRDILDIKDIVRKLPSLSLEKLQRLSYLVDSESLMTGVFKTTYQILHRSSQEDYSPIEEVTPDSVVRTVCQVNVPLFSDPSCQYLRSDIVGIILDNRQQTGNIFAGYSIHPTTSTVFKKGLHVIRVWSRNSACDESWYRNPETDEITYAWSSSCELIGRIIESP
ncbi:MULTISPECIES: SMEK domain-containing protein [Cyanophyceae]|uniref:SMEK domain-containing protein n=1 Tax=Cyanophyceae TaxID=3028117 RepID=UPI001686E9D1|nr:SMEK domain-containing protein [Trichocoleus sp. FACHB-69]MBD1932075.1 SMEK domain-containing protein [Trichocoleus sp. FACHB-69]